jgi:hypothetical protein
MKGDRIEAVVDTGNGVRTFEIVATRAGRRLEVTTARGVVEVTEVTRSGNPVRTGRFMATRLIALVEYPALESDGAGVEVSTRRRMGARTDARGPDRRTGRAAPTAELDTLLEAEATEPDPVDDGGRTDRPDELAEADPVDVVRSAEQAGG